MRQIAFIISALFLVLGALAQTVTVSGKIINYKSDPVMGSIIQIKGTTTRTLSDNNGIFTLKVTDINQILIISSSGYKNQECAISQNRVLEINLEEEPKNLVEITVKGFSSTNSQARRRAESVQKTPESVVTFTKEDLAIRGINNVNSFATFVPNVSFSTSQNIGTNFLSVRGIPQIRNGESPVAIVIDGVFIPDPNLLNQELYDLAMVEVVKGPQGTLYGKNAIAGALNILTESPTNTFKNKVQLGYAKGNDFHIGFSSSGPIEKNKILYRIAGNYRKADGVFNNEFLNTRPDYLKDISVRGELKFNFNPILSATLAAQYFNTKGGAIYYSHPRAGLQMAPNDFTGVINSDISGESLLKNFFTSLKVEANFKKIKFQSVTSINNAKRFFFGDLDYLPSPVLRQDQTSNSDAFNQEFRLSSKDFASKLTWSIGAFFQSVKKPLQTNGYIWNGGAYELSNLGRFLGVTPDNFPISDFINKFNTIAGFGFVDYKLTKKLTFSAGLRYDNDRLTQENKITKLNPNRTDAQLQPKISLSFNATSKILLFANYGRGYRSGGYNQDTTAVFDASYKAEKSNNFEFGLKSSAWNDRLIFNASLFYIDFKNQQQYISIFGPKGLLLGNYNYETSKSLGFETEIKIRTSNYLDILASYGFTKAEITTGGQAGRTERTSFKGNKTPFIPVHSFSIAAQSIIPLNKKISLTGFLNFNGKGKIYWHDDNKDVNPAYSLLDLRMGIATKKFDFTLWGSNILNKKYYVEYYAGEISGSGAGDISWYGRPAIFGATATVKF